MDIAAERAYNTPFANSTLLPLLLLSLARQKNTPTPTTTIRAEYDYVIVGAGAAGSVVAARLSELECVSVLLLEAGKPPPLLTEVPAIGRSFWFSDIDWTYKTVPQRYTGYGLINRQVTWPSGKALGGSSAMNAMMFMRGNRRNYDEWAAQGAEGWSYKDVLPYFLKMEDNVDPEYLANGYHATSGPVTVERPRYDGEIRSPLFEAGHLFNYDIVDPNGRSQTGFYDIQATTRDAQRCSTAKAYLVPAENRTNLDIVPNAFVRKVAINGNRATGVIYDFRGQTYEVKARREVIMSAGTVNSAQLLMLSGIGPRKHLQDMNIPVVADLPVGENLHDHPTPFAHFESDGNYATFSEKLSDPRNTEQYIGNRTGVLSSKQGDAVVAFLNGPYASSSTDYPHCQLYFLEGDINGPKSEMNINSKVYNQVFAPYENETLYFCFSSLVRPKSRGTVKLNSANPYDPPLIDPNYYSDPTDMKAVVQGLKACQRMFTSEPLRKLGIKPFRTQYPGCEQYSEDEDRYLECQARSVVLTIGHPVGTAKMGHLQDPTTVVDPQLKVKGIEGLRVVDASVMPIIPSGNTMVPVIMVAEKASDIIKQTIKCVPYPPPKYNPYTEPRNNENLFPCPQ